MDDRDEATLSSLFVPDGRIVIAAGRTDEYVAPDGFGPIVERLARYARTLYLVGNHLCDIDGDLATGETYSIGYHYRDASADRAARVIETPIRYRDRYVRTSAGWRFEERIASILWTHRYDLVAGRGRS